MTTKTPHRTTVRRAAAGAVGLALCLAASARAQSAADASPFGVNAHVASDAVLERLADAGIRWFRIDVDWDEIERVEGQRDWATIDRVVDFAARRGLRVFGSVAYTPAWASGTADRAVPPRDPGKYLDFLREVARRYRGRIHALGVWNEPNLRQFWKGSRAQFTNDFLVPGLRVIREEAPGTLTCGPDLSSSGNWRKEWFEPILRAAGPQLDVITHHQYDGGDTVKGRLRELDALGSYLRRAGYGQRPFWLTEIGWRTGGSTSPDAQAAHLRGVYQGMLARPWWTRTFWYDSHGAGWGLLGPDGGPDAGQPRPAFVAYRDVIMGAAPAADGLPGGPDLGRDPTPVAGDTPPASTPATLAPATLAPTTLAPTTLAPTTPAPTTLAPTSRATTTPAPTTPTTTAGLTSLGSTPAAAPPPPPDPAAPAAASASASSSAPASAPAVSMTAAPSGPNVPRGTIPDGHKTQALAILHECVQRFPTQWREAHAHIDINGRPTGISKERATAFARIVARELHVRVSPRFGLNRKRGDPRADLSMDCFAYKRRMDDLRDVIVVDYIASAGIPSARIVWSDITGAGGAGALWEQPTLTPTLTVGGSPSATGDTLASGASLAPGQARVSADGQFHLEFQGDGNLVLYRGSTALWASRTGGPTGNLAMQGDGNLVIYDASGRPLWATDTAGNPGAHLVVQTDGNVVLYSARGVPLWATNTASR